MLQFDYLFEIVLIHDKKRSNIVNAKVIPFRWNSKRKIVFFSGNNFL